MSEKKIFDIYHIKQTVLGKKGASILIVVGIVGVSLIVLSEFWPASGSAGNSGNTNISGSSSSSTNAAGYADELESKLSGIIGQISGVGRVQIFVTVENGVKYIYEESQKTTSDKSVTSDNDGSTKTQENVNNQKDTVIIKNSDGSEQALILTEIQPTVKGVVVVCDGGNDPVVEEKIMEAITTALDIPANHVSISKMTVSQ